MQKFSDFDGISLRSLEEAASLSKDQPDPDHRSKWSKEPEMSNSKTAVVETSSVSGSNGVTSSNRSSKKPLALDEASNYSVESGSIIDESPRKTRNILKIINAWMIRLGGETQGVVRVPEEDRNDRSYWNSASMWLGGNLVIAAFTIGTLGPGVFGLKFWDSVLTIIFFTLIGCLPVAALSTFGPISGLRQMVLSRYWFGWDGARIAAFINCVACVGWSAVNTMASANVLHVINHGGLPEWAGILIIALASLAISLFGYHMVHFYERWAWIPNFAVFLVIVSRMGMSHQFTFGHMATGPVEAAGVLSFGCTVYGFAAGWGPYASDYTCYKPSDTPPFKVFLSLYFMEAVATVFPMIIGVAVATPILHNSEWKAAYDKNSTGGLLWMCLVENSLHGFGQFCMVVLSLSTIANNIPNLYTFACSAQSIGSIFAKIPQYAWSTLCTGISIAIAIPGISSFESFLSDFMDIVSYWVSFYYGIVLSEHAVYRGSYDNYTYDTYNDPQTFYIGIASIIAGGLGVVGLAMGMAQTFFVGPIGKLIGLETVGGDIGFELAFAFGFLGHALLRWIEIKWFTGLKTYAWNPLKRWERIFPWMRISDSVWAEDPIKFSEAGRRLKTALPLHNQKIHIGR